MLLDQRRDSLCQAPTMGAIGRRVILLIDGPPAARTGEGQLRTWQLQQLVATDAQCLHDRIDQTPIPGALANFGVLIQEAVGKQRDLTRPLRHRSWLVHATAPLVLLRRIMPG